MEVYFVEPSQELVEEFQSLVNPGRRVPAQITRLTGISDEMLLDQPRIDAVFPELRAFIGSMPLVAHNADFDVNLLKRALLGTGLIFPTNKVICTMKTSVALCQLPKTGRAARYGGYKWPTLSDLAHRLNVNVEYDQFHDALYDCGVTKECILRGQQRGLFV